MKYINKLCFLNHKTHMFSFQIWLKDKSKKPQSKHIQARAEYLLKYLSRCTKVTENTLTRAKYLKKNHSSVSSTVGTPVNMKFLPLNSNECIRVYYIEF